MPFKFDAKRHKACYAKVNQKLPNCYPCVTGMLSEVLKSELYPESEHIIF